VQARFNAAVDGNFVVKENELRPALGKLRAAISSIIRIHSPNCQRLRSGFSYKFSYLLVLLSIIIGLAITQLPQGLTGVTQAQIAPRTAGMMVGRIGGFTFNFLTYAHLRMCEKFS